MVLPGLRHQPHDWSEITGFAETSSGGLPILFGGGAGISLRGARVIVQVGYYINDPSGSAASCASWLTFEDKAPASGNRGVPATAYPPKTANTTFIDKCLVIWSGYFEADVGSAAMDNALSDLLNSWSDRLPQALHAYREALERRLPQRI